MEAITTTNLVEKMQEKIIQSVQRPTTNKKDVKLMYKFGESQEKEIAEAHNKIVATALPRNSTSIPASILVMNDGRIDVNLPIGLTKSQRNKVLDMNTKDKGKFKIMARLQKKLDERSTA